MSENKTLIFGAVGMDKSIVNVSVGSSLPVAMLIIYNEREPQLLFVTVGIVK